MNGNGSASWCGSKGDVDSAAWHKVKLQIAKAANAFLMETQRDKAKTEDERQQAREGERERDTKMQFTKPPTAPCPELTLPLPISYSAYFAKALLRGQCRLKAFYAAKSFLGLQALSPQAVTFPRSNFAIFHLEL